MIAYIEGQLAQTTPHSCIVITASGLGYEVWLTPQTLSSLSQDTPVKLYTSQVIREDSHELFGFASFDERQTFLTLTSISKVGPKTALNILARFQPQDLRQLVFNEDIKALTQVSGIGAKSAQQIFLELKYKLKLDSPVNSTPLQGYTQVYRDALVGLAGLGYVEEEAAPVLKAMLQAEPDLDVSAALRQALKALGKK